jgi:hypothetical protein
MGFRADYFPRSSSIDTSLGRAEAEHDTRGIPVSEYKQSVSNPAVSAAGDAALGACRSPRWLPLFTDTEITGRRLSPEAQQPRMTRSTKTD